MLSDKDLAAIHKYIRDICQVAVAVNADDSKFPEDWLFKHRWVCASLIPLDFDLTYTVLCRGKERKRRAPYRW